MLRAAARRAWPPRFPGRPHLRAVQLRLLRLRAPHLRPRRLRASWPQVRAVLVTALLHQRGRYALWLPVCMGTGTLLYFGLRTEPAFWIGAAVLLPAGIGAALARRLPLARGLLLAVAAAALGFAAAQTATLRAPPIQPLPRRATWLTGTVLGVETLPVGSRVLLGSVMLTGAQPDGPPTPLSRTLRLRLHDNDTAPRAGDTLRVRALLRAPSPPAYPGAWDLQRDAYFSGLAGYGFALGLTERLATAAPSGLGRRILALRDAIARRIEAVLPVDQAGIAATLLTGNTAAIPPADRAAFRDSGLAHLLAVAGLHIGIVMGLVMALVRTILALSERATLFWPTRQIGAIVALLAGGAYMLLTGMHVPILRSFTMACLFTLAVLAGRRAVSVRGLALAATVLILAEPAQVPGVSFQMSFSAVLALIAGYEALRPHLHRLYGHGTTGRRVTLHIVALALTSLLAGTASAPFGAYHFGRVQLYFIPANMIAVPLAAFWVMPAGLIALALMPLHLEALALVPMGWGVAAILYVARVVAACPDATLPFPPIPDWGIIVLGLGIAWLGLWRGRLRLAGIAALALGLASPLLYRPPDILVSSDARLIALRTPHLLYVEQAPGAAAFTLDAWTQFLALPAAPLPGTGSVGGNAGGPGGLGAGSEGADSRGATCDPDACLLRAGGGVALLARGTVNPWDCQAASLLIAAEPARRRCPVLPIVDRFTVWRDGAAAIWLDAAGPRIVTDRERRGARPWVPPPPLPRGQAPNG